MRLISTGLIVVVATIAATRITLSADLPAPAYAPPVAAPYNWTGSYIGGNIGYGWGSDPIDLNPFAVFPAGAVPISLADKPPGVLGGGPYGSHWQIKPGLLWLDSCFVVRDYHSLA